MQTWQREQDQERAQELVNRQTSIAAAVRALGESGTGMLMTRIHGDFHLGQVLVKRRRLHHRFRGRTGRLDSGAPRQGESTARCRRDSFVPSTMPARRSSSAGVRAVPVDAAQRDHLVARFRARAATAFLRAYWQSTGSANGAAARNLLDLFLIEKAAYEIAYEAAYRPTWIGVPLAGLARLTTRITGRRRAPKMTDRPGTRARKA